MLTKFWEGLGEKLAEQWVTTVLAPAFVFWAGGLLAWITAFGWDALQPLFTQLAAPAQIAALLGALVVISASAAAVQPLVLPALRALEGYWPRALRWLHHLLTRWQNVWLARSERRWQQLATQDLAKLTSAQHEEYVTLERRLRLAPANLYNRMPTRLGNILRAAERRPADKYGLDAVICWPRLWLLLPDGVKNDLSAARTSLDTQIRLWIWGVLFLAWSIWAWWAIPVGLLVAWFAYQSALSAAEVYGDLLEAAFDLHRTKLYEILRLPLPTTTAEQTQGRALTEYLLRGPPDDPVAFSQPQRQES